MRYEYLSNNRKHDISFFKLNLLSLTGYSIYIFRIIYIEQYREKLFIASLKLFLDY